MYHYEITRSLITLVAFTMILSACNQPAAPTIAMPPQATPEVAILLSLAGAVLGVVVDENNQVLEVESGNAAANAGVQVGDLLESLDDVAFKDKAKVKNKVHEHKEGQVFKLKLKRHDKTMTLDITPAPPAPRFNAPTATPVWAPQDYF